MKPLLFFGLLLALATARAASLTTSLPANSPWLNDNIYLQVVKAGDRLMAVGGRGAVIYSDDQGTHWQQAKTPTQVLLTDVCFSDARHGWAVGHDAVVLATTDGGLNWTMQYSDPLHGQAVGHLPEDNQPPAMNPDPDYFPPDTSGAPLLGVWCDPSHVEHAIALGGFGYFLETQDGGAHWHKEMNKLDNPEGLNLYAIASVPNSAGGIFIAGEKGIVFLSQDHGKSWKKLTSPYDGTFFGVTATGPGNVLIYGLQGNIWLTHDYGRSWIKVNSHTQSGINNGAVMGDGSVLLVGNDGVLLTSYDRGQTFSRQVIEQRATLSSVLPIGDGKVVMTSVKGIHVLQLQLQQK
jgi:photosystem II stability/assembly factor-like uncharacterized protein